MAVVRTTATSPRAAAFLPVVVVGAVVVAVVAGVSGGVVGFVVGVLLVGVIVVVVVVVGVVVAVLLLSLLWCRCRCSSCSAARSCLLVLGLVLAANAPLPFLRGPTLHRAAARRRPCRWFDRAAGTYRDPGTVAQVSHGLQLQSPWTIPTCSQLQSLWTIPTAAVRLTAAIPMDNPYCSCKLTRAPPRSSSTASKHVSSGLFCVWRGLSWPLLASRTCFVKHVCFGGAEGLSRV